MADPSANYNAEAAVLQREKALSRWDNEGGAEHGARPVEIQGDVPELTNVELVHLRVRVIALENLLITLLAEGTDRQLEVAHEMATYISPREGYTQHPLTIRAADHINDMVERALHFPTCNAAHAGPASRSGVRLNQRR